MKAANNKLVGETKEEQIVIDFVQRKVELVAKELIKELPEVAENNPLEIGRLAKEMVFEFLKQENLSEILA